MNLYPAIDLHDGKCVRLYKGDYNKVTEYGSPIEVAKKWEECGAKLIHLVDLDGALVGVSKNLDVVREIINTINIDVELGGGIRSLEQIDYILNLGVKRVILGSIALRNPEIVKKAIEIYGSKRIVVGVDTKGFMVATDGWTKESDMDALEFCKKLESIGVKYVIFTDISRDGTLSGINEEETKTLVDNTNIHIIASGGVKSIDDLRVASKIGCEGIIIGKALYNGNIDLKDAFKEFR